MNTQDVVEAGVDFARTPFGTLRAAENEISIYANHHQLLDWARETGDETFKNARKLAVKLNPSDDSLKNIIPQLDFPPDVLRAWIGDVMSEAISLVKSRRPKRRRWASVPRKKKSRLDALVEAAQLRGLVVAEFVGEEDRTRRIRFGRETEAGVDYDTMEPLFTAMGIKEAEVWLSGYITGMPSEANNSEPVEA